MPDAKFVGIISKLVSFLADEISSLVDNPRHMGNTGSSIQPLPDFVRSEIASLVNQENVKGLLTNLNVEAKSSKSASGPSEGTSALASYALTLLRVFPRRGDEIRMWLYQGSTSGKENGVESRLPAIKYFYQAASATRIFKDIVKDPAAVVTLLKPDHVQTTTSYTEGRDQQWRVIFLFLELYTFPLKIMDDEEFLSGSTEAITGASFTRQSALSLYQVQELTTFLKNLTFSMYWNASEIAGMEDKETETSLAAYFGQDKSDTRPREDAPRMRVKTALAGVNGLTFEYVKRMVTGVLRMLYERE